MCRAFCGLLWAQKFANADCCCVVSLAGEAKAFLFEQYFTQRLLADPRYESQVLNSNIGGGGGWAKGVRAALRQTASRQVYRWHRIGPWRRGRAHGGLTACKKPPCLCFASDSTATQVM